MKDAPQCSEHHLHPDLLKKAEQTLPDDGSLFALADLYNIFGDSTRLRILYVLYETELCVCDIAQICGMTVSAISHQLRILKQARLVRCRRTGKSAFYSLADSHVHTILAQGMEHIHEQMP